MNGDPLDGETLRARKVPSDPDEPWAWWWSCERGHRCAVLVETMRLAYVRPTCTVMIDEEGHRCWGRLVLSLEPVLPIPRPDAPS